MNALIEIIFGKFRFISIHDAEKLTKVLISLLFIRFSFSLNFSSIGLKLPIL